MDLKERFENNLEAAKEERPKAAFAEQVKLAQDWTVEDVTRMIGGYAAQRLAGHQEAINKWPLGHQPEAGVR